MKDCELPINSTLISDETKAAYADEAFNNWVTKQWQLGEIILYGLTLKGEGYYKYKQNFHSHTTLHLVYLKTTK